MPGRKPGRSIRPPRSVRLASGPALYVLNRAGRLALIPDDVGELEPISSADADAAIKASMARESDKPSGDSARE